MKPFFALLLLLPVLVFAQSNDWGAFSQRLDAATFRGKKFRLEAAVKAQLIDPTAEAEIWVRVDRPSRKPGFFYNMMDKPIRANDWKVYSISGTIDKDAEYLAFGGLYGRKGIFYFDNFRLFVEEGKGVFKEVVIPEGGFEADSLRAWGYLQRRAGFVSGATSETAYAGTRSFRVDGSQFVRPPAIGSNDSLGRYAAVNGIRLYYETYGQGEPLLLLHGNSESIASFRLQIPELAKHFKVIAVDTRGQGRSTEDGKPYSYDLFAADMNAFLDHLGIDSARILGWSDGGNTGLIMAMQFPAKVKRLVTMGANVFIDKTVVDGWVFRELRKQLSELKNDTAYARRNRVRLINLLLTEPNHSFAELRGIKCPVLVLAGEKDVIREEHTRAIARSIPNATLLIAPKETHEYPRENPAAFNKTVLDFLLKDR